MWSKDLGRTIDYLETRPDVDRSRLAYPGFSWGGAIAPQLLAVETRLRVAVLWSAGFGFDTFTPESDPFRFAPRVKVPLLLLNDRFDSFFPEAESQLPFFRTFGTPEKDRRRVVYDSGHGAFPLREGVKKTLAWLDRYLGPVAAPAAR